MGDLEQPFLDSLPISNEAKPISSEDLKCEEEQGAIDFDYTNRAQWLRAAVLGANDGLLSTASLMMGVGAVQKGAKIMILTGVAGLIAGAFSMAIGEFVSVYSQYDIEIAQMKRDGKVTEKEKLPNPFHASMASGLAFAVGSMVPLLGAAFFIDYNTRLVVVVVVVSIALLVFGGVGAFLGKAPMIKSSLRVLTGGWMAMCVTFGLTKLVGHVGI